MPGFAGCRSDDTTAGGENAPAFNVDTARVYRWRFEALTSPTTNYDLSDILIYAKKAQRPQLEIDDITVHHGQDEIYTPGKQRWKPIEITFYEAIGPDYRNTVARSIYNWWFFDILDRAGNRVRSDYKRQCSLALIDGYDNAIWRYEMYGCWITKVTPDDLDYAISEIAEITFTLRMDAAAEMEPDDIVISSSAVGPGPAPSGRLVLPG